MNSRHETGRIERTKILYQLAVWLLLVKLNEQLINHKKNLIKTYVLLINEKAKQVVLVRSKLKSPLSHLREKIQKLDNIEINLKKSISISSSSLNKLALMPSWIS